MARYTQNYTISTDPEKLRQAIVETLTECQLSVTYVTDDYVMAQETAGQIAFSKLVTVEVLIHQSSIDGNTVKLTCVIKNGELPLRLHNHCQKMADLVNQEFASNQNWKLLESLLG
jgi:hypothetical protein